MKNVFIHPTAVVENDEIGANTRIWAYVHIMPGAQIGENCNIGDHCFIESGVRIGDNATIKNGNMIWEGVTLQEGVFIGPHVFFTNDLYPRSPRLVQARKRYHRKPNWLVSTLVKRGASLGAGAIILAGLTIGEYAMIGAGAVVTKDIPPYALAKGNPARVCGWVCQCGFPLVFTNGDAICSECGQHFREDDRRVKLVSSRR